MRNSLSIQLDRLASDRWARRGVRTLLRAAWLGLSLCCLGLGAQLLFDIDLPWQWLAAAGLACVAIGALLVLRPRLSAAEVARRLDRRFQLNEQLATAIELGDDPAGVEIYLAEHSRRTAGQLRRHLSNRQGFPWSEVGLIMALLVVLGGMFVLLGVNPWQLGAGPEPLPPLVQPADPAEQFPEEAFTPPGGPVPGPGPGDAPQPGSANPAVLSALADALRDQSVTRSAAEALDGGDLAGAAQSLRELADQAGQISPQARDELGSALRDAARQLAQSDPGLAEQLRESANGLQSGDTQSAAQALEDLADAVEQLGGAGQPGETGQPGAGQGGNGGAGQGSGGAGNSSLPGEQREQRADRLGVDGVPLELESQGEGDTPTQGQTNGEASGQSDSGGFTQGDTTPDGERVQAGDDPLQIPPDLRDVVQDYFSP